MRRLKGLVKALVPERIPWFAVGLYNEVAATAFIAYYQRVSSEIVTALTSGLRFGSNFYDIVISTGAFHAWKKPSRVLNECWRVLKPGGQAWIYDPAGRPPSKEGSPQAKKLKISELFALKWGSNFRNNLTLYIGAGSYDAQSYQV